MADNQRSSASDKTFKTIKRETTLANRVTHEIERLIVNGQLEPGDRLPSERELAEQFGVSRTVVREAVRALVAKGLLEVRPGSGTTVRQMTKEQVVGSLNLLLKAQGEGNVSFEDLHQVRALLEIEIAGLAASQATDADIETLKQIMTDMETAQDNPEVFATRDADFHRALAHTTHNPVLAVLSDTIRGLLQDYILLVIPHLDPREHILPYHRHIFERVAAQDEEGARHAMREHLRQIRKNHQMAFGGDKVEP